MRQIVTQKQMKRVVSDGMLKHKGFRPLDEDIAIVMTDSENGMIKVAKRDEQDVVIAYKPVSDKTLKLFIADSFDGNINITEIVFKKGTAIKKMHCVVKYDNVKQEETTPINPTEIEDAIEHVLSDKGNEVANTIKVKDLGKPIPRRTPVKNPKSRVRKVGTAKKTLVADPIGCLRKLQSIQEDSLDTMRRGNFGQTVIDMQEEKLKITALSIAELESAKPASKPKPVSKKKPSRKQSLQNAITDKKIIKEAFDTIPVQRINPDVLIGLVREKTGRTIKRTQVSFFMGVLNINMRTLQAEALHKRITEIIGDEELPMNTTDVRNKLQEEGFSVASSSVSRTVQLVRARLGKQSGRATNDWEMGLVKKQVQEAVDYIKANSHSKPTRQKISTHIALTHKVSVGIHTIAKVLKLLAEEANSTTTNNESSTR